jgi:PAS domain S-box-containing protein
MAFKDLPIRSKITRVVLLTTVTVVLLTVAAFIVHDYFTYRHLVLENLRSTSSLVAEQSRLAFEAGNQGSVQRVLQSLKTNPRIRHAAVFQQDGEMIASYPSSWKAAFPAGAIQPGSDGRTSHFDFSLSEWVDAGDHKLLLYLESDPRPIQDRMRRYVLISLATLGLAVLAAAAIGNLLQARISGPILALAARVHSISGSPGPISENRDEAMGLTEAFEQMISRLNASAEARSFMAAIVASADSAIIGKTLEGKIVSWNAGAAGMLGYEESEAIGKGIGELLVPPDRVNEDERVLEEVSQGLVYHAETRLRRKDGFLVDVSLTVSPIRQDDGRIVGASYVAVDMTARRQAERDLKESRMLFSSIISSAMDAIISVDEQQRVTIFNAAAEKMFQFPQAEALGQPLDKFIPARFRGSHHQHVEEFGRTGTTSRAMGKLLPLSALRANGEEFPIEASISQCTVNGKKAFTVILRDITERKQAEEQLQRFSAELERRVKERTAELIAANREMESFTYSVAHDLRAPLRHIDAFSSILEEDFAPQLPDEARQYLANIQRGSRSMSRLVDDLLNLARVGRQELNYEEVDLNALANEVARELTSEVRDRAIEWQVGPLPKVRADAGLLRQVMSNLLSNAVKYTRPRSPAVIEIGSAASAKEVEIFVKDNGVGFNMNYVAKLFGVFQRLHRSEDFEGTGVGLAIVDRVVRRHGGRVWAESTVGKGAAFHFTLPLVSDRLQENPAPAGPSEESV